jgi:uncharacterized protein (TIGR03435 family)
MSKAVRCWIVGVAAAGLALPQLHAQQTPSFDVVSIVQRNALDPGGSIRFQPGGRFQATNVFVLALIAAAYNDGNVLLPGRIEGGPDWIRFDRFDVTATTIASSIDEAGLYRRLPTMLQPVLADRFHLKAHWETRPLPTYALVISRTDGRLGPRMRRSTCRPSPEALPTPNPKELEGNEPQCLAKLAAGSLDGTGISMASLASALSTWAGRIVFDRTALLGRYDIKLQWTPDALPQGRAEPDIPPLTTALREQLGLRLVSRRGPVRVLIIDHIDRPTPN